ncbi:MAG: ABC transporter ATP-binding protein [Elusimicrobia bacterium]|nr:ABC transporter ATP-binding protein [Elusimicrobiota bacterium]
MADPKTPLAVQMTGIVKEFARCRANDGAGLSVAKGEVHALVGENGAGKSTLMKILYGLYTPDGGDIRVGGAPVRFAGPEDAIAAGVGMVHQHFMLVPTLTVAENVVLAREPSSLGGLVFDKARAEAEVEALSKKFGLALDPKALVGDLSVGEQQRLEILKVLYRGAEILILDEPTAVLTPQETKAFFQILSGLRAQGKTVILITHKLQEVLAISHTVTVMRLGKTVGSVATAKTSEAELAQMMVGRPVLFQVERTLKDPAVIAKSPAVLELRGVTVRSSRGHDALKDVSFTVRAGEIFGVAGVEGNGQTELIELLTGLRTPGAGTMTLVGKEVDFAAASAADMFRRGVAHVPEDRHRRGLVLDYAVSENVVLGRHREPEFASTWTIDFSSVRAFAERMIKDYDIRPADPSAHAKALSGGNQQKVVVAREMSRGPKLLVASQPTRGVDVGAIELIHKKIIAARDAGAAVVLVSAELSEILSLSDTIGVLYRGAFSGILSVQRATEETIGVLMAGGKA